MRYSKILIMLLCLFSFSSVGGTEETGKKLFSTLEQKDRFAGEISFLIAKAWKTWQDSVVINNVDVEGSCGLLRPGGIGRPVITVSDIMTFFDRTGKSQGYIDSVRAVAGAVENGMRNWQRGYTHEDIPFPQGASCTFTLPLCENIPVAVGSGRSTGDKAMTEEELYSYMLYRTPEKGYDALMVFHASAEAVSAAFIKWKHSCSITGISASGGIAPNPAPMGTGPGPVRGATGTGGRLTGAYFDGDFMRNRMREYFRRDV